MTHLLTGQMSSYRRNIAQVVAQAAIHLHNEVGSIGTALFDSEGTLVFNNNALRYANESIFAHVVAECLNDPGTIRQRNVENATIYAVSLDGQHVFIIAGKQCDRGTIDRFLFNLRRVLPKVPITND